jgi:hypothetical protein
MKGTISETSSKFANVELRNVINILIRATTDYDLLFCPYA